MGGETEDDGDDKDNSFCCVRVWNRDWIACILRAANSLEELTNDEDKFCFILICIRSWADIGFWTDKLLTSGGNIPDSEGTSFGEFGWK
jgi:hypothetical protein